MNPQGFLIPLLYAISGPSALTFNFLYMKLSSFAHLKLQREIVITFKRQLRQHLLFNEHFVDFYRHWANRGSTGFMTFAPTIFTSQGTPYMSRTFTTHNEGAIVKSLAASSSYQTNMSSWSIHKPLLISAVADYISDHLWKASVN